MDLSEDSFREILNNLGFHFIKLAKLDFSFFLFTFLEPEDIDSMEWDDLKIWVAEFHRTQLSDLIQPRLAWVKILGLPSIVITDSTVHQIIGSLGKVVNLNAGRKSRKFLNSLVICLSTLLFEKINVDRKVLLEDSCFNILIQEVNNFDPPIGRDRNFLNFEDPLPDSNPTTKEFVSESSNVRDENSDNITEGQRIPSNQADENLEEAIDEVEYLNRDDRLQDWNLVDSSHNTCFPINKVWGIRVEESNSSSDNSNQKILLSSGDSDLLEQMNAEEGMEFLLSPSFNNLHVSRRRGRPRKIQNLNLIEPYPKQGTKKRSSRFKKSNLVNRNHVSRKRSKYILGRHGKSANLNQTSKVADKEIL